MRHNTLSSCYSCLVAAKSTPGSYPWRLGGTYVIFAMRVILGPPAECNTPLLFCCITLEAKQMNTRVLLASYGHLVVNTYIIYIFNSSFSTFWC